MILLFSTSLFVSALLLFWLQPLVSKMVLPLSGGTPAFWNTCIFFFQTCLLSGYAWAHLSIKRIPIKWQKPLQLIFLVAALTFLPFQPMRQTIFEETEKPALTLLLHLISTIGFPLLIVSSLAPLIQHWFSLSGHNRSKDPYFLYATSNVGSMTALLIFPFSIERFFTTIEQSRFWALGFMVLGIMILVTPAGRGKIEPAQPGCTKNGAKGVPDWKHRFFWLFTAFVPSSLMLSVTAYFLTDMAAIPLFFIIPLALYLLTFIIAFSKFRPLSTQQIARFMPFLMLPLVPSFFALTTGGLILVPLHLLLFFCLALGCHTALAASRPHAERLSEFYLFLALGGALGGLFAAFVYPVLFNQVLEYPLGTLLACLIITLFSRHSGSSRLHMTRQDGYSILLPGLIFLTGLTVLYTTFSSRNTTAIHLAAYFIPIAIPMAWIFLRLKTQPVRFAISYAMVLMSVWVLSTLTHGKDEYITRNFYGIKRIKVNHEQGIRSLVHGVTVHGRQYVKGPDETEPLAYFHRSGPLGEIFTHLQQNDTTQANIGVVGLGVGSLAAYAREQDNYTFYEIDPEIISIAESGKFFTFLPRMKGRYSIVSGDARLKILTAEDHSYDMIFLDAFNSDAIPVHLLTQEAIALYRSKLKPRGFLIFQLSNRYVNLKPVLARHAIDSGLICIAKYDAVEADATPGIDDSEYAVMGSPGPGMQALVRNQSWQILEPAPDTPPWTDQYSSILNHLKWKW